jgi:hypothetical protein
MADMATILFPSTLPNVFCLTIRAMFQELSPQNKMFIITCNRPPRSYCLFFAKIASILSRSSLLHLSAYRISWCHVDCCNLFTHLTSLNACNFGTVQATGLESVGSKSPLYRIAYKSTHRFKSYERGHRLTDKMVIS